MHASSRTISVSVFRPWVYSAESTTAGHLVSLAFSSPVTFRLGTQVDDRVDVMCIWQQQYRYKSRQGRRQRLYHVRLSMLECPAVLECRVRPALFHTSTSVRIYRAKHRNFWLLKRIYHYIGKDDTRQPQPYDTAIEIDALYIKTDVLYSRDRDVYL